MLKFFRRYNKIILVIGGALLMIAFLVPQALQQVGQANNRRAYAVFDGGSISPESAQRAASALVVVQQLTGSLPEQLGIEDNEHWLLLVAEAERAGFVGGPADAQFVLQGLVEAVAQQISQQSQGQISQADAFTEAQRLIEQRYNQVAGTNTLFVDTTLAQLFGINRLRFAYTSAPQVSVARARLAARDFLDTATTEVAVIPADALLDEVPEPSDAEVEAFFQQRRDLNPGEGEFGFGYRLPVGAEFEWITVDPRAIRDTIRLDPIEVRKAYEADRSTYPGEYAQERSDVEQNLRDAQTQQILDEINQVIIGVGRQDIRDLPREHGFYALPDDWRDLFTPLERIAERAQQQLRDRRGIEIPAPTVQRTNGPVSPQEAQSLTGIGQSFLREGVRTVSFPQTIPQLRGTGGSEEPRYQQGVIQGPARDLSGRLHYFRFTGARQAGPPEDIAPVRERVVEDLRRVRAFELLQQRADAMAALVASEGVAGAAREFDENAAAHRVEVSQERAFSIDGRQLPALVQQTVADESFRAAVMEQASTIDPTASTEDIPASERSFAVAAPSTLSLALGRVLGRDPLTRDEYEVFEPQIVAAAIAQDFGDTIDNPFSFERLKARLNYRETRAAPSRADEYEEEEEAPETAPVT